MSETAASRGLSARDIVVGYGKNAPILEGLSTGCSARRTDCHRWPERLRKVDTPAFAGPRARPAARCSRAGWTKRCGHESEGSCASPGFACSVIGCSGRHVCRGFGCSRPLSLSVGAPSVECAGRRGRVSRDEDAGVADLVGVEVGELSGGQRQRVWIAMSLAQATDILLLDEQRRILTSITSWRSCAWRSASIGTV